MSGSDRVIWLGFGVRRLAPAVRNAGAATDDELARYLDLLRRKVPVPDRIQQHTRVRVTRRQIDAQDRIVLGLTQEMRIERLAIAFEPLKGVQIGL